MCVCVSARCHPLPTAQTDTHALTPGHYRLQTHHRWPARLVFSPPPPSRIMPSSGPSSSSSAPFLFCQHVCPSNGSVCLGQWEADKEPAYPPPGCWIGGHVVPVIEGTIAPGMRGRERVWHPSTDGEVQPGWPPSSDLNLNLFKQIKETSRSHMIEFF